MAVIEQPNIPLAGIEDESLALILELQRQDGKHLGNMAIGKKREGSLPSDLETALKFYLEEVAQATVFAFDRRVARSIKTAVREDADTLHHLVAEERMATQDHHMSQELSRGGSGQSTATPAAFADIRKSSEDEDMELINKLAYLYVTGEHDDTEDIYGVSDDDTSTADLGPESSAWAASRPQRTRLCCLW